MLSQGQDDDSEEMRHWRRRETEVSLISLRDVMAVMTRRFEHLLIEQEKRRAKLFDELFGDDAAVDESMRPEDVLLEYRDSVAGCNASLATEDTRPKEQSTDGMSELQCAPVGLRESVRSALQLESETFAVRHMPNVRAVKGVVTDHADDDNQSLKDTMADRFSDNAGHHYAVCREPRGILPPWRRRTLESLLCPIIWATQDGRGHWIDDCCRS